ncbi:MAG: ATP-dependent sacrificial sulfur transferase LarE [Lachnospiraceae bacterium]|nr:ATP-dependent sacrificial sulfur transferase LarE [Lachnospiraceae bacterium]
MTGQGISEELSAKFEKLKKYINDLGSLAVGFSGGVDSSFLLAVAHEVLGERAIAVTVRVCSVPERELDEAKAFCEEKGVRQILCPFDALSVEAFRFNRPDRCYHCKLGVFSDIIKTARENGIENVAEGSNMDDMSDYRPGHKAIAELGVKSPLREAGLYKDDIRKLSRAMGLKTWDKPSYACLASRFVYGDEITVEKLKKLEAAEGFLIDMGFAWERVRLHGDVARIEVPPADIPRIVSDETRKAICDRFRKIGFMYVALDLNGYRTGSMNAMIGELAT